MPEPSGTTELSSQGPGTTTAREVSVARDPRARPNLAWRATRAFGAFWWDFLVSDTPEFFLGVLALIGVLWLLERAASLNAVAIGAFPSLVVVLLAASVVHARRRH